MQGLELFVDEAPGQPQQRVDLGTRPRPVFRRKREQRQVLNVAFGEGTKGASDVLRHGTVSGLAREAAALCPASVAVHDYRHVARYSAVAGRYVRRRLFRSIGAAG